MESLDLANYWPSQPLAVVIGAGGMGATVARRLGQRHRILLVDIDGKRLNSQAVRLQEDCMRVEVFRCDITDRDSVAALAERVKTIGSFSALAHVTGLSPSMADWRQIMAVNLIGPVLVTNALFPLVGKGCAAVLIASLSAHMTQPDQTVTTLLREPLAADFMDRLEEAMRGEMSPQQSYSLSKHAVVQLARRLAVTWGERGGRVVSVSPGLIASPQGLNEFKHSSSKMTLLSQCPLGRQGGMQEIADAVEFLVSTNASYINGIDLLVDGGLQARHREANVRD